MKVPHTGHAFEFMVVVAQASDDISARHGLSFLDKNFSNVEIKRQQEFPVLVASMINEDSRTTAFFDVRFHDEAIGDCDNRLSGWPCDVDTLVDLISTLPVGTHPAVKVGDDLIAKFYA